MQSPEEAEVHFESISLSGGANETSDGWMM